MECVTIFPLEILLISMWQKVKSMFSGLGRFKTSKLRNGKKKDSYSLYYKFLKNHFITCSLLRRTCHSPIRTKMKKYQGGWSFRVSQCLLHLAWILNTHQREPQILPFCSSYLLIILTPWYFWPAPITCCFV